MTNANNTLINIDDFKKDCENHEQLTLALLTMIEVKADEEAIRLICNEVREQAELINSLVRFVKPIDDISKIKI